LVKNNLADKDPLEKPKAKAAGGFKSTKNKKEKGEEKKDKSEQPEEPWWPPFVFDAKNALKSKLSLNLKNCQYDLFRNIAIFELGWRVIDSKNRLLEAPPDQPQIDPLKYHMKSAIPIDSRLLRSESTNELIKQKYDGDPLEYQIDTGQLKVVPEGDFNVWDIFWADAGMSPEFLSGL
jgi:hypothetical protein